MRIDGDRANRKIFEAFVAADPGFSGIIRDGDNPAAPKSPARRPKPAVTVDDQTVDDIAGKRNAVARVLPRSRAIVRDVNLAAASAEEKRVGVGRVDDQRTHIRAVKRRPPPL